MSSKPIGIFHRLFLSRRQVLNSLLLLCFLTLSSFKGYSSFSQNTKIEISDDMELSVVEVFELISSESDFTSIYKTDLFDDTSTVILKKGVITVGELLEKALKGTSVDYKLDKGGIFLFKKPEEKTFSYQDYVIRGTVVDDNGLPMPGVNITIEGTTSGVQTDFDGNYTIIAEKGQVLRFEYVGFETITKKIGDDDVINVKMKSSVEALEGVVITGFQNIEKELFTGATQTLAVDDIDLGGVTDVSQLLQGQAAGVTVQSVSGTFGAAPRITIRGSSSILGDTRPLWVIDGAIQEGIVNVDVDDLASGDVNTLLSSEVAGLNVSDIESIDILRDASATAQYGARALNGVIVVTTKSGKRNSKASINYSAEFAFRTIPRYSQFDLLDSREDLSVYRELEEKGFLSISNTLQNRYGGLYNLMYRKINDYNTIPDNFDVINTPEEKAKFLQGYEMNNTNWFDVLFRSTPTQTHTLSFSGGSENSTSYASLSYFGDPGWSVADKVRRLTGNIKNSYFFADDRIKATFQLNTSFRGMCNLNSVLGFSILLI